MTSISANFKENDLNTLLPAVWGFMNSLDSEYQFEIFKVKKNKVQEVPSLENKKKSFDSFGGKLLMIIYLPLDIYKLLSSM